MIVGYARTSTTGQIAGLEAQERELRAAGCDKIFREQVSSVAERQQLEAALDYVREGDRFVCTKLDRLARSVGDLLAIVARLEAKKVCFRVLSMSGRQPWTPRTSIGRLMLAGIGAMGHAHQHVLETAVDNDLLPIHETGTVAGQEQHYLCHILGCADAPYRDGGSSPLRHTRGALIEALAHRCSHQTRAHYVTFDPYRPPLHCELTR